MFTEILGWFLIAFLTMRLLSVPIEVSALYALVSFALWFRSRHLRGLPMWRFWA